MVPKSGRGTLSDSTGGAENLPGQAETSPDSTKPRPLGDRGS
ncbi:hypothetical protein EES43_14135 [Streptomyces sp. ADI96-02]|nr:hypothetical protein EES43_14135 [Streptomyces sp. ADI96-02]